MWTPATAPKIVGVVLALLLAPLVHAQQPAPTPAARRPTPTPQPRVMVALVFGQSNAGNWGETRHRAHPRVRVFFRGRWSPAADPLPGADGAGGSVWTRLGDKIIAAGLYDRVVFVPAAIGGTEIAKWAPGGLLHEDLLRNIRTAQRAGLRFTHLLWHQGESDAVLDTDSEHYRRLFLAMLASIRKLGVDAPVFVARATRCGMYPPNEKIRAAQAALIDPALGIYAGPDTDQLGDEHRYDGCHFSAAGLERHAELWLEVLSTYERAKLSAP
ncbi:MAG: sialate O-acetylesterase [Thermoflexales bacterium]|nr:sialate O-acetylesterase [Thermoflexales bacterium]MCX7939437.1 sialate O-acetylesterase [Thermoflexales bacterium]MDW8052925.1 sialate O-acetylesterase [Anaerolineae bacterium]MDW8291576.1 sialate O-acetylesterase [Anaerolineae bacterium]